MCRRLLYVALSIYTVPLIAQIAEMPPNRHCPLKFQAEHYYYDPSGNASSAPHHVILGFDDTERGGGLVTAIGILHGPSASEAEVRSYPSREFIRTEEIGKNIQTFKISMDPKANWHLRGGGSYTNYLRFALWVEIIKFVFKNGSDWTPDTSGYPDAKCTLLIRHTAMRCRPGNRERNPFCSFNTQQPQ